MRAVMVVAQYSLKVLVPQRFKWLTKAEATGDSRNPKPAHFLDGLIITVKINKHRSGHQTQKFWQQNQSEDSPPRVFQFGIV